jgi:hypothetical protein
LLADLVDAAPYDVVDLRGIEAAALRQRTEHVRGQVYGVVPGQSAAALADWGADAVDNHGVSVRHGEFPSLCWVCGASSDEMTVGPPVPGS